MKVLLELSSCLQCPYIKKSSEYSLDGWDRGYDCSCHKLNDRPIQNFVEHRDEVGIPDWCPLKKA
jgi:hypothetical protein